MSHQESGRWAPVKPTHTIPSPPLPIGGSQIHAVAAERDPPGQESSLAGTSKPKAPAKLLFQAGFWSLDMNESVLECPSCRSRFNYLWSSGGSFNAVRLGTIRTFRCPQCHLKKAFDIRRRGHDATLSTYDDRVTVGDLLLLL